MAKPPTNIAASVRARLLNLARQTTQPFDVLLTRFVHERLLYRLSRSPQADRFVLKGAMLLTTWLPKTARGTRDLDLLGFGDSSEQRILGIFREVFAIAVDDGVDFGRRRSPRTYRTRSHLHLPKIPGSSANGRLLPATSTMRPNSFRPSSAT